jgi:hypothetical protein
MEIGALRSAESTFYRVGVSPAEAREVLDEQLENLRELARFVVAHVHSVVLGDEGVVANRPFVESIDLENFRFDEDEMRARYAEYAGAAEQYTWAFDPTVLRRFRTEPRAAGPPVPVAGESAVLAGQGGD